MQAQRLIAFSLFTALLSSAIPARTDDAAARRAFREGKEQFTTGKFVEAAQSFRLAYELKPNWKLLYNIGQSEVAAKRYGLALQSFEKYLAEGGDDLSRERQTEVLTEIKRLREMVGSVNVRGPDGCEVLVDGEPIVNRWRRQEDVPAATALSDDISAELKQLGFRFVGSTIVYAYLQATGLVNDHLVDCFRFRECVAAGDAAQSQEL